jgi:PAS domain S-box-containing protein
MTEKRSGNLYRESVVLVVDDNSANLGVVAAGLEQQGYRILVAEDGAEALERATRVVPDIILLDVMMPGIDGFEVCRQLKAQPATKAIPVIFMTVLADMKDKLAAFEAGAIDYVTKPLQVEEVIARVGTQLELAAHRENLERLVAERTAELATREREIRSLVENAPDIIVRFDHQCRYIFANPRLEMEIGIPLQELQNRAPKDIFPGNRNAADFQKCIEKVIASGQSDEFEIVLPDIGEGVHYHNIRLVAERDGQGQVVGALIIGRDITERKRTERQLELLNHALDHAFDATYLIDTDLGFRYVNQAAARALGYHRDTLLSMKLSDIAPDVTPGLMKELMSQTMTHGAYPGTVESQHRRSDGKTFPVEIGAVAFNFEGETLHLTTVRDISERKAAERTLHEQQQALIAAVENSPDAIVRYDRDGRRIYANAATRRAFGPIAGDMLGRKPVDDSILTEPDEYYRLIHKVQETGEEQKAELSFYVGSDLKWADLRFAPEFDANNEVVHVLVVGRDITQRKNAEEQLQASEKRFRTLADNFPDFLVRFDAECRHIYVNPMVAHAFGVPAESFTGKRLNELELHSTLVQDEVLEEGIRSAFTSGKSNELEARWKMTQGDEIFEIRHIPEKDAAGEVVSVMGIGRNITRLRAVEEELRLSERQFRTLAENLPDILVRYNRECQAVYVNPRLAMWYACETDELIGTAVFERLPDPEQVHHYRQALERVLSTAKPEQIEIELPGDDGRPQILQVSFVAEQRGTGEVRGALAISRDITRLKETERQLEESNAQLKAMARRRETAREEERKYIARELHDDLGQYLTALRLQASVLNMEYAEQNPAMRVKFEQLLSLVDSTKKVTRNLSQRLRPAELDMGTESALSELADQFSAQYGISCNLELDEETDKITDSYSIILYRMLQESLTNIARHAEAKRVEVVLQNGDDGVMLMVSDDGKGFDPSQVKSTSFGLLGMRERLLAVGGELEIFSEMHNGTRVVAHLPNVDSEQGVTK